MNVMMIGDAVAGCGRAFLAKHLRPVKKMYEIDLCVVNGENSANGNGITPDSARELFDAGADVITTGNHVYRRAEVYGYLDSEPFVVRPANYPAENPGRGYCIVDRGRYRAAVVNLCGIYYMENIENPFKTADRILEELKNERISLILVDFHAEATSEKKALGFYLDGRASVVAGTHTHVQTSDAAVLPGGTGYITDLGMTGNYDSVLGVDKKIVIKKFTDCMPARFDTPVGPASMEGCVFALDEKTGKCTGAQSFRIQ
ncbi:MAG: TIGR00282 family metallophosphoesterase [Clostridia bacterium]|nr:TIGR00282 family metallophosphoesterase [Clostridia bacterium]